MPIFQHALSNRALNRTTHPPRDRSRAVPAAPAATAAALIRPPYRRRYPPPHLPAAARPSPPSHSVRPSRAEHGEQLGNLRRWQSPGTTASSRTAPRRAPGPRWHLGTETIPAVRHASSGTHIMRRRSRCRSLALSSGPRLGGAARSVPAPAGAAAAAAGPGEGRRRRRARHR